MGPKSDSPCFRQAEAAVIRAVDVATPATVAVVVAVAAGDRGRASAGFWLGESRHTRDGRMVELRSLAIFKKREVYQFIMFMNFWGGGLFQRFFGMFTPAKFWEDEPNLTSAYFSGRWLKLPR